MSQNACQRKAALKAFGKQALGCLLLAFLLNFVVEALSQHSPLPPLKTLLTAPWTFIYNTLLIACTLSLALFFRRRVFAAVLISTVWIVLGVVNCVTRVMRITPLNFYDFVIFVENFSITNSYVKPWQMGLIAICVLALLVGLALLFRRAAKSVPRRRLAACCLAALCMLTAACTYPYARVCRDYTDPSKAYAQYGFAYSLLRSAVSRGVSRPEKYDKIVIDDILTDVAAGDDAQPALASQTPNFIFLQLESFLDPVNVTGISCSENPVPTFTRLKEQCSSGYLYVPTIGGGTANVEFEVLTGMNLNDFGTGEYPYSTVLQSNTCESIAHDLKALGYAAHAIHSHTGTFYQRHQVFPCLGFDTFTPIEYMNHYTTNALGWCRDEALTGCILDALRADEARDVIFTVSVQGHGKYQSEAPETPYEITVTGLEDNETLKNEYEYYVSQLKETDDFLAQLLSALQEFPEPVVLVVYGDHLPAINLPEEWMRSGSMLATEYVIWSNDGSIERETRDLHAYQLTAYTMGRYGINNGILMRFHQQCAEDADYLTALHDLEYDMLYGDKYLYEGDMPYQRTEMRMGVKPITLTGAQRSDEAVVVRGQNFTRDSVVYAQGRPLETYYIDSDVLVAVPGLFDSVSEGEEITVAQVALDGTVLGQTKSILCALR